jgi:hypothetical protein
MKSILILALLISNVPFLTSGQEKDSSTNRPTYYSPVSKIYFFKIGNRNIPVQVTQFGKPNGIVCINLHDNEYTSVNAAMWVLRETGGTLIRIQNKRERIIKFILKNRKYGFDPNRMFSGIGIKASLERSGRTSEEAIAITSSFGQRVLGLIPDSTVCVIALHNNTKNAFSVKSYLPGNDHDIDAIKVYHNPKQDEDDFILTTDSNLYREMMQLGYNAILQDNMNARKDGSLSVYYGELNKRYVNIETEHGKTSEYARMLKSLFFILKKKKNSLIE